MEVMESFKNGRCAIIESVAHLPSILYHLPASSIIDSNIVSYCLDLGAAYGTAKSGVGICSMGVLKPDLIFKSIVPIIMAGILGIYGLIVAVILNGKGKPLADKRPRKAPLLNSPAAAHAP